jgi:hypothetical protein
VAAEAAAWDTTTVATEGPAATLDEQPAAARTGRQDVASPDTANTVAESCQTTATAAVEEPVAVAAAAAAAPGATSAEEAAARAATVPVEADTATRRSAQSRQPHSLRYGSNSTHQFFFAA